MIANFKKYYPRIYLMFAAAFLILGMLGSRELWTHEHRWAAIVNVMLDQQDFFHPVLNGKTYYDKPLLSYWLMALAAQFFNGLNEWSLRLPSALAGILTVWLTYLLGKKIKDHALGLLSAWMLLCTYYFVYWAKVGSADMLNVAGTLAAITYYMYHKNSYQFGRYSVFFLIVALTALCKGLVGPVVVALAVLADSLFDKNIIKHVNKKMCLGFFIGLMCYFLPFLGSWLLGSDQSGLFKVYKENFVRYFQPFDHQTPFYIYFLYLPIYMAPWSIFLLPSFWKIKVQWLCFSSLEKWLSITSVVIFVFFSASGSRRPYYILPLIPFATIFVANWILMHTRARILAQYILKLSWFFLVFIFLILLPLFYKLGGWLVLQKIF